MKKIIFSLAALAFFTSSCVDETDNYNLDHALQYDVSANFLLTNAQKELADQMTTPSVNLNVFRFFTQYWAATQYTTESKYRVTTRKIPDNHWNAFYRDVLGNLESAKGAIAIEVKPSTVSQADWDIQQKNKLAIIEIQEVYAFQVLVDTFGDIPYTNALDPHNVLPDYEDDTAIYPKLITRLDAALANLDASGGSFDSGDYIFAGDIPSWTLFGNSLKLKLGINLADVNPTLAQATVESAFNAGVISNNSENAIFRYVVAAPNYNPIYDNLVASGRNDFVPASPIIDYMNSLNDPRRSAYFTLSGGNYVGGNYGYTNAYSNFSHVSDAIKAPNAPGPLFEAMEVDFYLAEAAARGYNVGDTAENYYNKAIHDSFAYWGLSSTAADAYLLDPSVAYATAAGTWQEKIGNQAWIAYFNRGFESWTTWRRLDFPNLAAPASAYPEADGVIPKRLTYPINEQTVNGTNYQAASTAIGGDRLATKVFWDIH